MAPSLRLLLFASSWFFTHLRRALAHAMSAAHGPDGSSSVAWLYAGEARLTLFMACNAMLAGQYPPLSFHCSLLVFLPQGALPIDSPLFPKEREPSDHRTLNLKNSDNKAIAVAVSFQTALVSMASRVAAQRGFVAGEQIAMNAFEIDADARAGSIQHCALEPRPLAAPSPILVLFDDRAAFAYLAHRWLFSCLSQRAPKGLLDFLRCLYFMNSATIFASSYLLVLFSIASGVLQGCSSSVFLFDLGVDAILTAMIHMIGRSGILRACADDFSASLDSLAPLEKGFPIFHFVAVVAGLSLNLLWGRFFSSP